jgi:hypothetical protein
MSTNGVVGARLHDRTAARARRLDPVSGTVPHLLPLGNERSWQEQRVALAARIDAIVKALGPGSAALSVPTGKNLPNEGKQYVELVYENTQAFNQAPLTEQNV